MNVICTFPLFRHAPWCDYIVVLWIASACCFNRTVADDIQFNRDIRPILSDHCFACHGPDANHREANLRLDTQQGLLGQIGNDSVSRPPDNNELIPVIPGNHSESLLWQRIVSADEGEVMPPPEYGKPLTKEQMALLRRWIDQGATWEGHWSFSPIVTQSVPVISNTSQLPETFLRNEIDYFTLSSMQQKSLAPAPQASRRDLIRRLSFDLHGLPPTSQEAAQFIADDDPMAYERTVDRLLDAPQFGERMAMWWLDLVRYADSVGYHGDQSVSVSPYRDYVINAFNDNKPFDLFTIEQLAGDLLPEQTIQQQIASGYNRLGMMSAEGGVQPKEYLSKYIAERVRNLGGTWLGATLGCCECHDHKYDPFTAKDFYSLEAFFADIEEQGLYSGANDSGKWGSYIQVPTAQQQQSLSDLDAKIKSTQELLDRSTPELEQAQQVWESQQPRWMFLKPSTVAASNGTTLQIQEDESVLASGPVPATEIYSLAFSDVPNNITGIRLEVLPHPSLPAKGPGRAGNGNFVLSEILVSAQASSKVGAQVVDLQNAIASFEQTGAAGGNPYNKWAIAAAIDKDIKGAKWGWAVMEKTGQPNWAIFQGTKPILIEDGGRLYVQLLQQHDNPGHVLGRFRISVTTSTAPISIGDALPAELADILETPPASRTVDQKANLARYYRSITKLLKDDREKLSTLQLERQKLNDSIVTTLVTKSVTPRPVRVLGRGNWMDESGEVVQPNVPACLPPIEHNGETRLTRLDLAQWVVSRDNPLTARVLVNRLWKMMFGTGLSGKLDDLGAQGEPPTHPELLDYLAYKLIDSNWDIKKTIKLIAMSGTYQQSSSATHDQIDRDPLNRWVSRQSRIRLEAEMIRDNALRISGLLVEQLGGPSVKPYQPPGYWAHLNFPTREWQNDSGDKLFRRGLYTHWQRQYLHPSLLAFDAPSREECTADRPRSNTPLQSLVLLNDPIYVEAARSLAQNAIQQGGTDPVSRLEWIFQRAVARSPRQEEVEILSSLLQRHITDFSADPESAKALLQIGTHPKSDSISDAELAGWISVARTILNLHEVIVRY